MTCALPHTPEPRSGWAWGSAVRSWDWGHHNEAHAASCHSRHDLPVFCCGYEQTEEVFGAALEAMRAAGVELVPMDMDLVIQLGRRELPDTVFYTYEYPRELSRWATPIALIVLCGM